MQNEPPISLPGHYVAQIFELLASRGAATAPLCRELQLDPSRLQDSHVSMPWPSFQQLLLTADRLFADASFGLLLGERLLINTHGPLGYAALTCTSLRELAVLLEQYLALRTDLFTLSTEQQGDDLLLRFHENRPLAGIRVPVSEAVVLAVRNMLDFSTLGNTGIHSVAFPFAGDEKFASEVFHCPVHYNELWCGFRLRGERLDQPLKMANASSYRDALAICQEELLKLTSEQGLAHSVRKLLLKSNNGFPSLDVVARHLHLTPRTLHRHLQREGTSFKLVLDAVRHSLALRYLDSKRLSIQEIAYVLGYTEIANFRRAFKRWEGIPPSEYQASRKTR